MTKYAIGLLIGFPIILALRSLWQAAPGLATSVLFFAVGGAIGIVLRLWRLRYELAVLRLGSGADRTFWIADVLGATLCTAGWALNAAVVIANSGFMPTALADSFSAWVSSATLVDPNLMALADVHLLGDSLAYSIGDVFLASGILALPATWAMLLLIRSLCRAVLHLIQDSRSARLGRLA